MVLTITYKKNPATDLGYLLHKNPSRPQTFNLSYGKAHVFYPKVTDDICKIALILDIDPIDLVKKSNSQMKGKSLFDYVNDRPYVSSSFFSVAIQRAFSTAMNGKSKERQELADKKLPFEANLSMIPFKGDKNFLFSLFSPLGYKVELKEYALEEKFKNWGMSSYFDINLEGEVLLKDLLNQLYILIPVLDKEKHYWVDENEIDKLLEHGKGWLENHPEKEKIIFRYLIKRKKYVKKAIDSLVNINITEEVIEEVVENEVLEKKLNLNEKRLVKIMEKLKENNVKSVLDIGCGEGKLIGRLVKESYIDRVAGADVSFQILEKAQERLKINLLPENFKGKIELFQSSIIYKDKRFSGFDAITVMEVIEHIELNRFEMLEKVIFKYANPKLVIITTPNIEYNKNYNQLTSLRHNDHRFEWTRDEFKSWCNKMAEKYNYKVEFDEIGDKDDIVGAPTQMGVFKL